MSFLPARAEDPMTDTSNEITNAKFRMWLRPDGIVQLVWEPGVAIRLDDAIASTDAMETLLDGRPRPLLVDAHATGAVDRLARAEYAGHGDQVSAVGLIVNTPMSGMTGNFFLRVTKPESLTRLFDDEASAVAWLVAFVP